MIRNRKAPGSSDNNAEHYFWPPSISKGNEKRVAVIFPVLFISDRFGTLVLTAEGLTTSTFYVNLERGDFCDVWIIDSIGMAAHVKRGVAAGRGRPTKWFGLGKPFKVDLVFDSEPILLSTDQVKARLAKSFEEYAGWSSFLTRETFDEFLDRLQLADTVPDIFRVIKRYYVWDRS